MGVGVGIQGATGHDFSSIDTAQVADKLGDPTSDCCFPLGGDPALRLQIGTPPGNAHPVKNRANNKTSIVFSNPVNVHKPCTAFPLQLVNDALAVNYQQFDVFVSQLLSEKSGISVN